MFTKPFDNILPRGCSSSLPVCRPEMPFKDSMILDNMADRHHCNGTLNKLLERSGRQTTNCWSLDPTNSSLKWLDPLYNERPSKSSRGHSWSIARGRNRCAPPPTDEGLARDFTFGVLIESWDAFYRKFVFDLFIINVIIQPVSRHKHFKSPNRKNGNHRPGHLILWTHSAYLGPVYWMNGSLGVARASVYAQPLIAAAKIWGCWV